MSRREDYNDGYAKGIADLMPALKACEGTLSSFIDGNTSPDLRACIAIRDMAQNVIADVEHNLQAPGNIKPYAPHENVIPNVVIQDNRLEQPSQADVIDAIIGHEGVIVMDEFPILPMAGATKAATQEREFTVMLRRPCYQFATEYISAKNAPDAVEKMRHAVDNNLLPPSLSWDSDDAEPVDWVHAELCTHEEGEADHAEWEPVKLSPAVLVEALVNIRTLCTLAGDQADVQQIERIVNTALNRAILGE